MIYHYLYDSLKARLKVCMMNVLVVLCLDGFGGRNIHFTETSASINGAASAHSARLQV